MQVSSGLSGTLLPPSVQQINCLFFATGTLFSYLGAFFQFNGAPSSLAYRVWLQEGARFMPRNRPLALISSENPRVKEAAMSKANPLLPYVLITPARNEEEFIEKTLESMVHQTYLPLKWVIVNDGSTDGTTSRIEPYASKYDWIELVNLPARRERNFAAKVHAFNAGRERVKNLKY
jgi:cellulose synthase/poly-beta-1,6-N-acetylglucosamine synthase-like glycosyltransferase